MKSGIMAENKPEIKLEKISDEKPNKKCRICDCNQWVKRSNGIGYVCGICHPKARELNI
jgi:hypothetical protein